MVFSKDVRRSLSINKYRFPILIISVATAGLSQGLTLPLLSILLEQQGVSASMNGWSAASLYIGMMCGSFIVEKPMRKYGYKPMIMFGILAILCSSLLIPVWRSMICWSVLRFLIGVGDSFLHCSIQLWVASESSSHNRGRRITMYGFAYGFGFSIGPLGVNLLPYGVWVPLLIVGIFYAFALFLVYLLKNAYPNKSEHEQRASYWKVIAVGWFALLPALLYGFLEATLNGSVPVYILRSGISEGWISIILFSFSAGALITQLPLGILSDSIGRKKVLLFSSIVGAFGFAMVPSFNHHPLLFSIWMGGIGAVIGSFFSLGLAFLADTLPNHLMPTGNILASVLFSLGSMTGPGIAGMGMQYLHPASVFYFLSVLFAFFFMTGFISKQSLQLKISQQSE